VGRGSGGTTERRGSDAHKDVLLHVKGKNESAEEHLTRAKTKEESRVSFDRSRKEDARSVQRRKGTNVVNKNEENGRKEDEEGGCDVGSD
jgi:hypothetical protein